MQLRTHNKYAYVLEYDGHRFVILYEDTKWRFKTLSWPRPPRIILDELDKALCMLNQSGFIAADPSEFLLKILEI